MKRLAELAGLKSGDTLLTGKGEDWFLKDKKRVHLLALGDVGGTLLLGLRLLGGDCLSQIGIYDIRPDECRRFEMEMNQIDLPEKNSGLPPVVILQPEELFDCDVFLFCASRGVPPVGTAAGDVRMAQYEANAGLIRTFASRAAAGNYRGLFAVVSDPVDPLCQAAVGCGLDPGRVRGFGLGVMNARARYYAAGDPRYSSYLTEGEAFGPHGKDLVIANSLTRYDDALSRELTQLTVEANLRLREIGAKPYIAPALSSGALSVLAAVRGQWHYSSGCLGGVSFGSLSRITAAGNERANPEIPDLLYKRLENAYEHLKEFH